MESIVVGELTLSKGNQCSSTSASTSTNKTCTPLDLSTEKRLGTCDESAMGPGNMLDLSLSKEKSEQKGTKEHCDKNLIVNLMTNEKSQTLSRTLEQTHAKDAGETLTMDVIKSLVNKPSNERKQPSIQCKKV